MATEKDRIISLFTELGIGCELREDSITLNPGDDMVTGYNGFYCTFLFNGRGKLMDVRIAE